MVLRDPFEHKHPLWRAMRSLTHPGWNATDGQIVLPGEFLPAAEKYGLIAEIDRWVVGRSVELAAQGRTVECNLSAASLESPSMLSFIEDETRRTGADPADLVFEMTETALMVDLRAGAEFARIIAPMGTAPRTGPLLDHEVDVAIAG